MTPPSDDHDAAVAAGDPAAADVGKLARRGLVWTTLSQVLSNGVRVIAIAILARLLTAADFGVVTGASVLLALATNVRDLGIGAALVQHRALTPAHIKTAFAVSAWIAVALAGAMFLTAGPLARLLGDGRGEPIIQALSALVLIRGLRAVPNQLAIRRMHFRLIALVDVGMYLVGITVTIVLAWAGYGPWALVWGYLAETTLGGLVMWLAIRPPIALTVDRGALRELMRFGAGQTLNTVANALATQGDYLVVGNQLGSDKLGFYNRAYELITYPSTLFNNVAGSVLFSSLSRLQDDRARLAQTFEQTLFLIAAVLVPASAGLVLVAPEFIRVLMGEAWMTAVVPFQIMACSMYFRTAYKVGATVARGRGDVYRMAGLQLVYAFNVIVGALIASRWGIGGVAVTTSAAVALHFAIMTWLGMLNTGTRWPTVLAIHLAAVPALIATLALAIPTALVLRGMHASSGVVLALTSAAGAVGYLGCAAWLIRRRGSRWATAWRELRELLRGGGTKAAGREAKLARRRAAAAAAHAPPPPPTESAP
jgi:O-antigen/teichoic acid export membrane protein